MSSGPLQGVKVVELAGLAPAPFAGMVLADFGADVVRVDRPGQKPTIPNDPLGRGKRSIQVDLKHPLGRELVLRLADEADVFIEGFRPGVTERLGLGPVDCQASNPGLIYARLTGWGQDGPLAQRAGHDINYVALSGALEPIGRAGQPPTMPLNLVGDFGGGGLLLVVGVLAALFERQTSGRGQVIDASMVEGAALLSTSLHGLRAAGMWNGPRGTNLLDGGAPFYDSYQTADGRYMAIGALEDKFYVELLDVLGLDPAEIPDRQDPTNWSALRERIAQAVRGRTRDEWVALAAERDACLTPVLAPDEVAEHPQHVARKSFVEIGDLVQPAPAPRFGRSSTAEPSPSPVLGADTKAVLRELGYSDEQIAELHAIGAVG